MAAKKTAKKAPLTRKKKAVKKPAPKKAISKKALKEPSTATAEAAPEAAPPAGGKKQTKTAFVLSFSPETPAKDVVAAGAAQGIQLSEKGVYKTRFLARSKGSKAPKTTTPKAAGKAPPKAVKAPRKPGKRGPGDGSGSAFIRSQPTSMKASEVVAAAAAQGITITAGLVYSVRQAMKKSGKAPATPSGKRRGRPPAAAKVTPKAAPKAVVVTDGGDRERQLISLALDLGLGRAVELIQGLRSKIDTLY